MRRSRSHEGPTRGEGERITLSLTGMAHQGSAIGRHNEEVVFVAYGIPGETVEAEVLWRHKTYLEARVVRVIDASPHRVAAPCPYYGDCGGCQWQHIDYRHQLRLKQQVVIDQLQRIGKFTSPPVLLTMGMEDPWHYRNHARFTVNKEGQLGFVRRGTHRVIPIQECFLMHPWINRAMGEMRGKCAETRQLAIRYGVNTEEWLIQPRLKAAEIALETGQKTYQEEMLGHRFTIASPSFFQVNTQMAERLIEVAQGYLALQGSEILVDAYAGVGTFAVLLAPFVRRIIAVEESASAVRDAASNAEGVANVEFIEGRVEDVLPDMAEKPDAVLLDPPRTGCHSRVIAALVANKPRSVVYVSCDPATLARDLRLLCDGGFRLEEVQPVDMFPQTYHIECVARLSNEE